MIDRTSAGSHSITTPTPARLAPIVAAAHKRAAALSSKTSAGALLRRAIRFERRSLTAALSQRSSGIIAEIKKASPSRGVFRSDFNPTRLARAYDLGGATGISVVTEPDFFLGSEDWIEVVRDTCGLPILRKDFIVDPIQVAESAALGADAILLIARILSSELLKNLSVAAEELGLGILYEAHDESDLTKLASLNPQMVGINARNLDDFRVDHQTPVRLSKLLPRSALAVAESGIESAEQIRRLRAIGYSGFLIGESLVRADDPAAFLRQLQGLK
ncbi:MAG TPA: indole-3-glycerol phosphate synthase TrpC [candidate division Zixibacteria bacterium]|jgi:indole-3-glycerol phosphate synthase